MNQTEFQLHEDCLSAPKLTSQSKPPETSKLIPRLKSTSDEQKKAVADLVDEFKLVADSLELTQVCNGSPLKTGGSTTLVDSADVQEAAETLLQLGADGIHLTLPPCDRFGSPYNSQELSSILGGACGLISLQTAGNSTMVPPNSSLLLSDAFQGLVATEKNSGPVGENEIEVLVPDKEVPVNGEKADTDGFVSDGLSSPVTLQRPDRDAENSNLAEATKVNGPVRDGNLPSTEMETDDLYLPDALMNLVRPMRPIGAKTDKDVSVPGKNTGVISPLSHPDMNEKDKTFLLDPEHYVAANVRQTGGSNELPDFSHSDLSALLEVVRELPYESEPVENGGSERFPSYCTSSIIHHDYAADSKISLSPLKQFIPSSPSTTFRPPFARLSSGQDKGDNAHGLQIQKNTAGTTDSERTLGNGGFIQENMNTIAEGSQYKAKNESTVVDGVRSAEGKEAEESDTLRVPTADSPAAVGEAEKPEMVEILGYFLPRMRAVDAPYSIPYVCVSDVFRTFFSKRHWDEFKRTLEQNRISLVGAYFAGSKSPKSGGEIVESLRVSELVELLLSNQARKEGFVRCTKLGESLREKVIRAPEESWPGELKSGIRTRHGDHSDIQYVEIRGVTLPTLALDGVQYVRLADVQRRFLTPEGTNVAMPMIRRLKRCWLRLGAAVGKCSPNQKARLVVYANSLRSASLHLVDAQRVAELLDYAQKKIERERDAGAKKGRKSSRSGDSASETSGWKKRRGWSPASSICSDDSSWCDDGNTSDTGNVSSGVASSRCSSRASRATAGPVLGTRKKDGGEATLPPMPLWAKRLYEHELLSRMRPKIGVAKTRAKGKLTRFGVTSARQKLDALPPVYVPEKPPSSLKLGSSLAERSLRLLARCKPCTVQIRRSQPLSVMVSNSSGQRGASGRYNDQLFASAESPCIACSVCGSMFSIRKFLRHSHTDVPQPNDGKLFMYVAGSKRARFDLWERLQMKLRLFRITQLARELPNHLSHYQRRRDAGQIPKPTPAKLEDGRKLVVSSREASSDANGSRGDSPNMGMEQMVEKTDSQSSARPWKPLCPLPGILHVKQYRGHGFDQVYERTVKFSEESTDPTTYSAGSNEPEKLDCIHRWFESE